MAELIFTANATTDVVTSTAHGLVTGSGPFFVMNVGGALPGGLSTLTNYYFIRIDADTGKIAANQANALANIPINLTTNGTGTQYLHIGLPVRRASTYAAGSQVRSADLNGVQDCAVSHLHGVERILVPVAAPVAGGATSVQTAPLTNASPFWTISLPRLAVGSRIIGFRARVIDSATGPTTLQFAVNPVVDGGLGSVITTSSVSAGTGVAQTLIAGGVAVADDTLYVARVNIVSGTTQCTWCWLTMDVLKAV